MFYINKHPFFRLSLLLVYLAILTSDAYSADRHTYAYLSFCDGTIKQYKIANDGTFLPLSPGCVQVNGYPSRVKFDPEKKYAYVTSFQSKTNTDYLKQFAINDDGTLTLARELKIDLKKWVADVDVDSTGKYLYVVVNAVSSTDGGGSDVFQYSIKSDGEILPLDPQKVQVGQGSCAIITHPTKPFVYVANWWNDGISQLKINSNGTLSQLISTNALNGGSIGAMQIDKTGASLYACEGITNSLIQCNIGSDGNLTAESSVHYGDEMGQSVAEPALAINYDNGLLAVCNDNGLCLVIVETLNGKIDAASSYKRFVKRDNTLIDRDDFRSEAKKSDSYKSKADGSGDILVKENAINEYVGQKSAMPIAVGFGPNNMLYVVTTSGIMKLKVKTASDVKQGGESIKWNDIRARISENKEKNKADFDGIVFPRRGGLAILRR